jgi:hypothetical protein
MQLLLHLLSCSALHSPSAHNISYDGFTTLLNTLPVDVQAGQRYHFKLAIADAGDHILDSAVWIAGGSLLVNTPPRVDTNGPFNMSCPGSVTLLGNATDDDNDALRYSWDLRSTTGEWVQGLEGGSSACAGTQSAGAPASLARHACHVAHMVL